jgi:hypothetical protein
LRSLEPLLPLGFFFKKNPPRAPLGDRTEIGEMP